MLFTKIDIYIFSNDKRYFRHGHISHHIHVGEQSVARAWRMDLPTDADVLSHLSYLMAMKRVSSRKATHHLSNIVSNALLNYVLFGLLAPVLDTLSVMLFAVPVGLFHLKLRWKSDYARRRLFGFLRRN